MPHNEASIKLLERNGFKREGLARAYLGSTAFGRTISSMHFWRRTRFPCGFRGAIAPERGIMSVVRTMLRLCRLSLALIVLGAGTAPAGAIKSVRVPLDASAIDLTKAIESYNSQGDRLLVSTAPGSDGIVRRIEVRAQRSRTRIRAGSSSRSPTTRTNRSSG